MNETLDYLRTLAAFPFALRRYRAVPPLTLAEAQRTVRQGLAQREANFLALVERAVYGRPGSPYLALLKHAGCEMGDLHNLVNRDGLDKALLKLCLAGVSVTLEEFKGRKPIVRPGLNLPVRPSDFDNPTVPRHFGSRTSGSTGAAMNVGVNLGYLRAQASSHVLTLAAHELLGAPVFVWRGILPDAGLRNIMRSLAIGNVARRWLSPFDWRASHYWLRYDLATAFVVIWMRLLGVRAPWPKFVGVQRAELVARALAEAAGAAGRCLLETGVSRGVRVGLAAREAGLDLAGVAIIGGGETPTPAKVRRIQESGAHYIVNYGLMEAGNVASGCACPADGSDAHLFTDGFALVAPPAAAQGGERGTSEFYLTTLHATAPKVMLNVQVGDYGLVEERQCGCALEACGYTTHVRQIQTRTKLTGEGVTLIVGEVAQVLDETLPARFGGTLLDYQLVETEDEQGLTRVLLFIHPRLPDVDEQAAGALVLDALRRSSSMADAAGLVWQRAGVVGVRRHAPIWTGHGKFPPVLTRRRQDAAAWKHAGGDSAGP